ncbi:putative WRKY transcription factor 62 [Silene latifolia]|uniref:putative WRKY transcription factor 62 n=1 Tax=Silene latifolia TaxID=37657 RepID=UPI003D76B355
MEKTSANKFSNDEQSIEKIIEEIEKSKESVHVIRSIILEWSRLNNVIDDDDEFQKSLDHQCLMLLNHIVSSISMLTSYDDYHGNVNKKRRISNDDCGDTSRKKHPFSKGRRGCYKRRRSGDSRVMEVSHLSDDGFGWRKYGQKEILNAKHPRNYYRCTHKHEQNCLATKKVQQISENPTKYLLTYIGNHTCIINNNNNNILNPSPILLESPQDHPSSILVSFHNNSNGVNNNSCLFPTTTSQAEFIKQEATPLLIPQDYSTTVHHQNSPCSDLTAVTGQSSTIAFDRNDEIISAVHPNHSSISATVADMEVDYINFILDDYTNFILDDYTY